MIYGPGGKLTKVGEIANPLLYPSVCSEHGDVLCAAKLAVHAFICNVFARPETERMSRADAGCWIGRGCVGGLRICQLAEERARQETRRIASTADNLSWTGRGKEARAAREPGEIPWSGSCHLWRWSRHTVASDIPVAHRQRQRVPPERRRPCSSRRVRPSAERVPNDDADPNNYARRSCWRAQGQRVG